jgi:hypothetical protein
MVEDDTVNKTSIVGFGEEITGSNSTTTKKCPGFEFW